MQQAELADLLVRRQQVAFHAVGKNCSVRWPSSPGATLALRAQALGNPLRQCTALDGIDLHRNARSVERAKPGARLRGLVQPGQLHQRERAVVAPRAFGNLLQRHAAILAGLARGDTDFNDLPVGKQAQTAPAASTAPQSKCAPATVKLLRSV